MEETDEQTADNDIKKNTINNSEDDVKTDNKETQEDGKKVKSNSDDRDCAQEYIEREKTNQAIRADILILLILLCLTVVGLIFIGIYALSRNKDKKQQKTKNELSGVNNDNSENNLQTINNKQHIDLD